MVSFLQALGAAAPNFMTGLEQGAESSDKRKKSQREDADYLANQKAMKAGADILSKYIGTGDQPAPQSPQAMPMSAGGVNSGGMGSLIAQAAQKYGIPPDVGVAMGKQESGLNPNAPHGGLMQILDSTARQPGYGMQGVDPASLRDPRANADFGMHYLAARNPNVDWNDPAQRARALQSYNGGGDPNYVAHVTGRMGGGGAPQASQQQSPQQSSDDVFSRYQQAMKAVWSNKDLAGNFQAQMAAAQHIDQQFKPIMEMAQHQQSMQHQQRQEELGARREADTTKHQAAMEGASVARQQELDRHNQALEERYARQDEERAKHDRATEEAKNAPKPLSASERKAQTAGTGILTQIDKTLSMLDKAEKSGEEVTGLTGMIKRKGGEFLTGGHAASDWEQQIAALQVQVPRALAGVGKLAKGDRDYINSIVEGLGPFRSHEQIRSSMEQLKGIISNVTGLDEQGGQAAPAQPVQSAGAPVPPKPGEVVKGYKFKGGNPADEKSWEKM